MNQYVPCIVVLRSPSLHSLFTPTIIDRNLGELKAPGENLHVGACSHICFLQGWEFETVIPGAEAGEICQTSKRQLLQLVENNLIDCHITLICYCFYHHFAFLNAGFDELHTCTIVTPQKSKSNQPFSL